MKIKNIYAEQIQFFLKEDGLENSAGYVTNLPNKSVLCKLKLKDDLVLAGLPFFSAVFEHLGASSKSLDHLLEYEGRQFKKVDNSNLSFELPFNIALSGERLALNLLQKASSIATYTRDFCKEARDLKVLDTRKTTPGLRFLEKYAVKIGGGENHRLSQTDIFMIKDNHKNYFGGVEKAIEFFKNIKGFYQPIILEIHDLEEILPAYNLGIKHFMLDNFSPDDIKEAVELKNNDMTYEVSGGIHKDNIRDYAIEGVDCVSSGSLTYNPGHVDISLKINE